MAGRDGARFATTRRNVSIGVVCLAGLAAILAWPSVLGAALDTRGLMPHGHCYLWNPTLVGLHVVSDGLIGLAYLAISVTLTVLVYRARSAIPFDWILLAFGAFILACGATHWMEIWTLWTPDYWISGNVKIVTAIASVSTALILPPLVPRVLQLVHAEDIAEDRRQQLLAAEERAALATREQALRREADEARAQAEEANRAKDQFLATVSHELRNPLSPILTWSRLLNAGTLDPDTSRQAIAAIERCAASQAQLIDDLLDVSRIVSGKFRLDVRPLDLPRVIEAALDSARPAADAKRVRVDVVVDPNASPISGDAERLQQVIWNLLSNAVKHTPRDGHVQVRLERINSHVELSVSDDGDGIDPAVLPRLFERFQQAETKSGRQGGLGLGLAIVRHIVELHGGSVSAQSEGLDRGSVFRVRLPLMPALPFDLRDSARRHPSAAGASEPLELADLSGVRVLVVDDEPDSNAAVQAVLVRCGADVRVAGSVQHALEIFGRWRPHVLVTDIGMPVQDGYALIAKVRARPPEQGGSVPALALTAYARTEDRVRTLAAGFQMHLAKPVDPSELGAVVARLARSS
jgi:signal transduction histidine kinase/ActR/RegA family two-component response regulator